MVTIAICEDEPRFAEELREKTDRYLTERGLEGRVRIFEDGEQLLNFRQNMTGKENCNPVFISFFENFKKFHLH